MKHFSTVSKELWHHLGVKLKFKIARVSVIGVGILYVCCYYIL